MSSADIAKQLATYDANKKSSADILNESMAQYGIPEIRSRVAGLRTTMTNTENALNAVDPSVTGRTSNSLVTEAQRQAIVNKERQPIAQQYGDQSRTLNNESANLTDQESAANTLAQGRMNDYTSGRAAIQGRYEAAVSSEAESRRQKEADRQYQLEKTNADRNYKLSVSEASRKAANDNGSPKKISAGEAEGIIRSNFTPGKDGYVNPKQWNSLLSDWNAEGLSTSAFVSAFKQYANPAHYRSAANAKKLGSYGGISAKG
jgi:hypothetical protein